MAEFMTLVTYGNKMGLVDILMDRTGGVDRLACEAAAAAWRKHRESDHRADRIEAEYQAVKVAMDEYDRVHAKAAA